MKRALGMIVALAVTVAVSASAQEDMKFAAVAANNEGNLLVRWGKTEAEAIERASRACANSSNTCAKQPATTPELDDVFAYYCCTSPNLSCMAPSHETREKAVEVAERIMKQKGFSGCRTRAYYSARTGKRL